MTKEKYLEMCEMLGTIPSEEEMPVELEDLPIVAQISVTIYETLGDEWEYMAGNYTGKNLQNLFEIFDLYEVEKEERLIVYKILCILDNIRKKIIRQKNK